MNEDSDPGILPLKVKAEAKATYERSHKKLIYDSEVFPPFTNKMKDVGRLRPRTFHIKCDGKGEMGLQEILTADERMQRLNRWKEKEWITDEEYNKKKSEILRDL